MDDLSYSQNKPNYQSSCQFNINDTKQVLKFFPNVDTRIKQAEFGINSSGIPNINQSSRIMVRNMMEHKNTSKSVSMAKTRNQSRMNMSNDPLSTNGDSVDPKMQLQEHI